MGRDDRLGLASSSEFWRLANCSGSKILIESLQAKGITLPNFNPHATLGERIHSSLEGYELDLNRRAQEIRDDCDKIADRAASEFLGPRNTIEAEVRVEERLWYRISDVPFFSGRPDRVTIPISRNRILDVNFKTGTSEEEDAEANLQMRSEVVLLHHHHPDVPEIGVLLSQPLATKQPDIVVYDLNAMESAETEILQIVDQATWDKNRHAGPWCKHCPARAWCPEARELAIDIPARIKSDQLPKLPDGPEATEMMARLEVAYDVLDAIWDAFSKKVAKNPKSVPGWQISNGKRVRSLPHERWEEFSEAADNLGFTVDEVASALKFSIPTFEEVAAKKWELKGKEFRQRFAIYFEEFFDIRQDAGCLQKIPKRLLKE